MPAGLVLSIIAKDRPGLVQTLAGAVAEHGGNWIESSMARLGGEFAGIVLVSIPEAQVADLEAVLDRLDEQGIFVTARRSEETGALKGHVAFLELTGGDHPGIVRDISATLARHGASIDDLETDVFTGSMSGEALFQAKARIVLPESLSMDVLREALEDIAQDVMVEIALKDAD
jgi:glycine cleavage system regulatory protein